jgi:hypothetical protein
LLSNSVGDSLVRMLAYSAQLEVFSDSVGPLINVPIIASDTIKAGTYYAYIKNCRLATVTSHEFVEPVETIKITVVGNGNSLSDVLTNGKEDSVYTISDDLAAAAKVSSGSNYYIFATDGNDNWIRLSTTKAFYDSAATFNTLKGVKGVLTSKDVNPTITVSGDVPVAGKAVTYTVKKYNLQDKYAAKADEVNEITGYFNEGTLRGYSPSAEHQGQAIAIDFTYTTPSTLVEGKQYSITVVSQLKAAWDKAKAAPKKVAADDEMAFQNYIDYVLESTNVPTAVNEISNSNIKVIALKGMIKVTGTNDVKVYTTTGALVSTASESEVPSGVYVVVAGEKAVKVFVR